MGMEVIKNGKIKSKRPCPRFQKFIVPINETKIFKAKEVVGMILKFIPKIIINAVYADPPPKPTDE